MRADSHLDTHEVSLRSREVRPGSSLVTGSICAALTLSLACGLGGCAAAGPAGAAGAVGATGLTGATGPAGPAGPAGISYTGTWQSTATYAPTQAVTYNGSTYLALRTNTATQPDLYPSIWQMLAAAGQTGATGSAGTAATLSLGSVTTLAAGQPASITNTGTSTAAVLNFAVPAGAPGASAANINQAYAAIAAPLIRSLGAANLFDPTRATLNTLVWTDGSILPWPPSSQLYSSDYILCAGLSVLSFNNNVGNGLAFYDANKAFISYIPGGTTSVAVPASAAYFRFSSSGSPYVMSAIAGPPAAVPPTYVPYGTVNAAVAQALIQVPLTLGPLAGKNLGVLGDSITAAFGSVWLPTVAARTNATFGFNDSLSGREVRFALSNYNNGAAKPNDGSGTSASGHTLAQDLAGVDLLLIELGTNDGGQYTGNNLGTPTDTPSMNSNATFSASIAGLLTTLLAAKPTLRIVWMTPWLDNPTNGHAGCNSLACSQGVNQTIVNVCAVYSVPVINLLTESGINASTWSTYLIDGVHPSAVGGSRVIGPLVGQKLNLYF